MWLIHLNLNLSKGRNETLNFVSEQRKSSSDCRFSELPAVPILCNINLLCLYLLRADADTFMIFDCR